MKRCQALTKLNEFINFVPVIIVDSLNILPHQACDKNFNVIQTKKR